MAPGFGGVGVAIADVGLIQVQIQSLGSRALGALFWARRGGACLRSIGSGLKGVRRRVQGGRI